MVTPSERAVGSLTHIRGKATQPPRLSCRYARQERAKKQNARKRHVGTKLAESTGRFNVYATKAKEHEEYLRRQLLDATTETSKALAETTALEELRLVRMALPGFQRHRRDNCASREAPHTGG